MDVETNIADFSGEVYSNEDFLPEEAPLMVFRVIGCTIITILVGFTIIIYVTSGMFHLDCLAQICSEVCILAAYMLILLTTTETSKVHASMCLTISILLHFFFLGAFVFSLLEVLCMCQVLVAFFQNRLQLTTERLLFIGWSVPTFIVGLSSILWHKQYTTKFNCWLNINQPPMWATVVPVGVCIAADLFLLFVIFCFTNTPVTVPQSHYKRAQCFFATRWASVIIIIMLTASWSCGILAYHRRQETLYAAFAVVTIVLGSCIFTLRISTDDEVRSIISSHLLCCIVNNKIASVSRRSVQMKKHYTTENINGMANGKIGENGSATSHR